MGYTFLQKQSSFKFLSILEENFAADIINLNATTNLYRDLVSDIYQQIHFIACHIPIYVLHINSHTGIRYNDYADSIAKALTIPNHSETHDEAITRIGGGGAERAEAATGNESKLALKEKVLGDSGVGPQMIVPRPY